MSSFLYNVFDYTYQLSCLRPKPQVYQDNLSYQTILLIETLYHLPLYLKVCADVFFATKRMGPLASEEILTEEIESCRPGVKV
jgi:hypothetical protein